MKTDTSIAYIKIYKFHQWELKREGKVCNETQLQQAHNINTPLWLRMWKTYIFIAKCIINRWTNVFPQFTVLTSYFTSKKATSAHENLINTLRPQQRYHKMIKYASPQATEYEYTLPTSISNLIHRQPNTSRILTNFYFRCTNWPTWAIEMPKHWWLLFHLLQGYGISHLLTVTFIS